MNPLFHTGISISDSLKTVRKSVLIYETIINNWEAYLADYDIDAGGFYHNQGLAGNGQSYEDFYKCYGVNLYLVWGDEWRDGELFTNADNYNAPKKSKYLEDDMHEYKIPNSNLHYKSTCNSINDLLYNGAAYTAYNPIAWAGDIIYTD